MAKSKEIKELKQEIKSLAKKIKEKKSKNIEKGIDIKKERRAVARRAAGARRLLGALGITQDGKAGRGRPKGSYKYGNVPIHVYKKLQSQRRAQYDVYKQRQQSDLQGRGLNPEQIQRLSYLRALQSRGVQVPQQIDMIDTPQSVMAPVDDDLQFRKFQADKAISPNTQNMLRRLRHTQLKSERDDVEMQRRLKERRMVADVGNILSAPFIFNRHQFDITGVDSETNILMAPNIFKEREDNKIMKTNRFNILQTKEAGNSLFF